MKLRRPRKTRFINFFKCKNMCSWRCQNVMFGEGWLQARYTFKLHWYLFETIRLRLAWSLIKKKRASRKTYYKQKMKKETVVKGPFKWPRSSSQGVAWYGGFPHLAYSKKPRGSRMGKGKGSSKHWYYLVKPGACVLRVRTVSTWKLRYNLAQLKRCIPSNLLVHISTIRDEMRPF